jgi:3-oxoadipate enol-lactonase
VTGSRLIWPVRQCSAWLLAEGSRGRCSRRWDKGWLGARPADRALAEGLAAAGQAQRDPAAAAGRTAQLEARAGHDVWDRLGAITCPALVAYGNYDQIAPARNSAAIASRVGRAELRGYEGGHLFLFQDPAALPEFEAFLQAPPG